MRFVSSVETLAQCPNLFPPATKAPSRRRRLHRLRSTHTRPLSRRNTAGRIIMYSISLRGSSPPLSLPLPAFFASFFSLPFALHGPFSLSREGRGARKKERRERGDEGSREGSRAGRRRREGREEKRGPRSLSPRDTRIHSLLGPTPPPPRVHRVLWALHRGTERKVGGERGCAPCLERDVHRSRERASKRTNSGEGREGLGEG